MSARKALPPVETVNLCQAGSKATYVELYTTRVQRKMLLKASKTLNMSAIRIETKSRGLPKIASDASDRR